jgi:geranylgeranyl pyrophosphate synthase
MSVSNPIESPSDFLQAVETRVAGLLAIEPHRLIQTVAGYAVLQKNAKRFRPRLVRAFGSIAKVDHAHLIDIAAAVEMIHCASLMHDDVVDDGQMRRGMPTSNARWGNEISVLAGDLLLSLALQTLNGLPGQTLDIALETVSEMSRAAVDEVQLQGKVDATPIDWERIAAGKTGALFALCGRAVCRVAGADHLEHTFSAIGRDVGKAFQLTDDLVDFSRASGKEYVADLRHGRPNFVVLEACRQSSRLREKIHNVWSEGWPVDTDCAEQIAHHVVATGSVEKAIQAVAAFIEKVHAFLGGLPSTTGRDEIAFWSDALREKSQSIRFEQMELRPNLQYG